MSEPDPEVAIERRNRIRLTLAAYAYEFEADSIMSDAEFDRLCLKIRPEMSTVDAWHRPSEKRRIKKLDAFWRTEFAPYTGQWIRNHPELMRTKRRYWHLKNLKRRVEASPGIEPGFTDLQSAA